MLENEAMDEEMMEEAEAEAEEEAQGEPFPDTPFDEPEDGNKEPNLFQEAAEQERRAEMERKRTKFINLMIGAKNYERLLACGFKLVGGPMEFGEGHTEDRRSDGSAGC